MSRRRFQDPSLLQDQDFISPLRPVVASETQVCSKIKTSSVPCGPWLSSKPKFAPRLRLYRPLLTRCCLQDPRPLQDQDFISPLWSVVASKTHVHSEIKTSLASCGPSLSPKPKTAIRLRLHQPLAACCCLRDSRPLQDSSSAPCGLSLPPRPKFALRLRLHWTLMVCCYFKDPSLLQD